MSIENSNEEIQIPLQNKMQGSYSVIGADVSETYAEITVRKPASSEVLAEILPRVSGESSKDSELLVKYGGYSDILAQIQPLGGNMVPAQIEVLPGNRMVALFEVQEPPKLVTCLNPSQDAYTRERNPFSTINYGDVNSLVVGRDGDEIYRSYIQFDLSDWSKHSVLIEASLKLHYNGTVPEDAEIEILDLARRWSEYSITHQNRPSPKEVIVDSYINNVEQRYIEFSFTNVTYNWINKVINNHGFIVRVKNETKQNMMTFRARETNRPPELCITYYDNRIYSTGRTESQAEIRVVHSGYNDTLAEIFISSTVGNNDKHAQLYVHRYEDPVDNDILAEITVTRGSVFGEVTVPAFGDSEVLSEVSVISERQYSVVDAEVIVTRPSQPSEIFVRFSNDKNAEVTITRWEDSDKSSQISVTKDFILSELEVFHRNDIFAEITVERESESNIDSSIAVTRELIDSEILVKYRHEKDSEVTVTIRDESSTDASIIVTRERIDSELFVKCYDETFAEITSAHPGESSTNASISVTRESVDSEITVKGWGDNEQDSELVVAVRDESDRNAAISVSRDQILSQITVVETSNREAELFVKHTEEKLAEINVHVHDSVDAEIDVIKVYKIDASIAVTRTTVDAEIMIPYWDDSDKYAEMKVRVLRVDDVYASIHVRNKAGAYAFII